MPSRWIIEAPLGGQYLSVRNYLDRREFFWTKDRGAALSFATEIETDTVSEALQRLAPNLFNFAIPVTGDTKSVPA